MNFAISGSLYAGGSAAFGADWRSVIVVLVSWGVSFVVVVLVVVVGAGPDDHSQPMFSILSSGSLGI